MKLYRFEKGLACTQFLSVGQGMLKLMPGFRLVSVMHPHMQARMGFDSIWSKGLCGADFDDGMKVFDQSQPDCDLHMKDV